MHSTAFCTRLMPNLARKLSGRKWPAISGQYGPQSSLSRGTTSSPRTSAMMLVPLDSSVIHRLCSGSTPARARGAGTNDCGGRGTGLLGGGRGTQCRQHAGAPGASGAILAPAVHWGERLHTAALPQPWRLAAARQAPARGPQATTLTLVRLQVVLNVPALQCDGAQPRNLHAAVQHSLDDLPGRLRLDGMWADDQRRAVSEHGGDGALPRKHEGLLRSGSCRRSRHVHCVSNCVSAEACSARHQQACRTDAKTRQQGGAGAQGPAKWRGALVGVCTCAGRAKHLPVASGRHACPAVKARPRESEPLPSCPPHTKNGCRLRQPNRDQRAAPTS